MKTITLPDFKYIINEIVKIKATFAGDTKLISEHIDNHRAKLKENIELIKKRSDENKINIFKIFISDLLMRAVRGERGVILTRHIKENINGFEDLDIRNYRKILTKAGYRFLEQGIQVMNDAVNYLQNELEWKWSNYFNEAEKKYKDNFTDDNILKIINVSFKVRDLALSNFSSRYVANDLHVARVSTRMGLLYYGYDIVERGKIEMGNDPTNTKNYLFLHKLFLLLSDITKAEYSPVDIDRALWHFGRTICQNIPICEECPINNICLTGIHLLKKKNNQQEKLK